MVYFLKSGNPKNLTKSKEENEKEKQHQNNKERLLGIKSRA